MKIKDFVCDKCGECCRHLDLIPNIESMHKNGICKYLDGNLCSIYNSRPVMCNRFKLYELIENDISEEEFMKKSIFYCNEFKKIAFGINQNV